MIADFESGNVSAALKLDTATSIYGVIGMVVLLSFIVSIVAVCMWIYRAHDNLKILNKRLEYTSGWAVGYFFVPFANLVVPFKVMREITNGTKIAFSDVNMKLKGMSAHSSVLTWWLTYIFSGIIGNIANRMIREERIGLGGNDYNTALVLEFLSLALLVLSFFYLIQIVKNVSQKQHQLMTGEKLFIPIAERGQRIAQN